MGRADGTRGLPAPGSLPPEVLRALEEARERQARGKVRETYTPDELRKMLHLPPS
ncbi:hypothetical protein GCM10009839_69490 [Catenulispora yoronensis]|uniref:Uncharacterized protein n=1 Tax=Catenulispora yoronensis TaxID=450799 RepID=A0ABN2V588_9ACTN